MSRARKFKASRKGEMGATNLILFISAVLVAAVSTTVIMTTSQNLREQSKSTGERTMNEISTGIKVFNLAGDRNDPNTPLNNESGIQVLEVGITTIFNSDPVCMDDMIIEISDENSTAILTYHHVTGNYNSSANSSVFTVQMIRDAEPQNWASKHIMNQGDIGKLYINVTGAEFSLEPKTYVDIQIIPEVGIPSRVSFTTDSNYTSRFVPLI